MQRNEFFLKTKEDIKLGQNRYSQTAKGLGGYCHSSETMPPSRSVRAKPSVPAKARVKTIIKVPRSSSLLLNLVPSAFPGYLPSSTFTLKPVEQENYSPISYANRRI